LILKFIDILPDDDTLLSYKNRGKFRASKNQRKVKMRYIGFILSLILIVLANSTFALTPQNYLYTSSGNLVKIQGLITRSDIQGVQVIYNWKSLEKNKDEYDFSAIEQDLNYLNKLHKKLFIQIQDHFFKPDAKYIPAYLMQDPIYQGGLVPQYDHPGENAPVAQGWVTQQWNPAVQARYKKLLFMLGQKFDGRILGINLPETAIDIDQKQDKTGFSCDNYFRAELENLKFARNVFKRSQVVQYVNFWPCEWDNDHHYMSRLFAFAAQNDIGLGGPDIVPNKKAQMKNAYPFFHRYKGKLRLIAMAVQEPTLTYINPKTKKPFTKEEIINFSENYLGANIIFWSPSSPWLEGHPIKK